MLVGDYLQCLYISYCSTTFSLGSFDNVCRIYVCFNAGVSLINIKYTLCSAKFDFISGCVSAFIHLLYRVFKEHYIIWDSHYIYVCTYPQIHRCVFFLLGVVCCFVCKMSLNYVQSVVFEFDFNFFAIFYVDLL